MKDKKIFSDGKSVAFGLLSTLSGIRDEIENIINVKIEKFLNQKGYVSREDFHALEDRVDKLTLEIKGTKSKNKKK